MHQLKEIYNLHASKNSQNRQKPVMLTLAHSSSCMHHHSQPVCATQAKHTDVRTLVLHPAPWVIASKPAVSHAAQ